MSHKRLRYTSDLTDAQWDIIQPMLPLEQEGPGRPIELDMREAVNAMLYITRTGCQWDNLPHDFPPSDSVYYHYNKWCKDGTWRRVNQRLRRKERQDRNRTANPSAAVMDSQSVETTEAGGPSGFDAAKQVNGRKRHIIVDTVGNVLDVIVSAANLQDRDGAKQLLNKLKQAVIDHLKVIWADGAYQGQLVDWVQDQLQILLDIVKPDPDQDGFEVLPKRWVVERTLAWLGRYRRLSKDYERLLCSSEGMVYIASIHTMLKRLAA